MSEQDRRTCIGQGSGAAQHRAKQSADLLRTQTEGEPPACAATGPAEPLKEQGLDLIEDSWPLTSGVRQLPTLADQGDRAHVGTRAGQ